MVEQSLVGRSFPFAKDSIGWWFYYWSCFAYHD